MLRKIGWERMVYQVEPTVTQGEGLSQARASKYPLSVGI